MLAVGREALREPPEPERPRVRSDGSVVESPLEARLRRAWDRLTNR
ncbi:hypothetical protein GCM10009609_36780 [Pseudonocardia aurantiaca]|uniref:Uncharacterized protein n=1 Tax=Pseudonocardia aurantiaca TaxID=75290 RepID=A0ABW4FSV7_9PSEU